MMKKTTAALIFTTAALILAGCENRYVEPPQAGTYWQSTETDLCFLTSGRYLEELSTTEVPCTPKVLARAAADKAEREARK